MIRLCTLLILAVAGSTCSCCAQVAAQPGVVASDEQRGVPAEEARLDEELDRRLDAVFKRGLFFGYGVTTIEPMKRVELLVAPFEGENAISTWFETAHGMFEFELIDPSGKVVTSLRGQRGEQHIDRMLIPGKWMIELHAMEGARVHGVLGIRGSAAPICRIDEGRAIIYPADLAQGYAWPYILAMPAPTTADIPLRSDRLLVAPNNTGVAEDVGVLRETAICALTESGDIKSLELANQLGTPVLVPLFPRPELRPLASNLELQALTRASLEEKRPRFARVDLQLIAMIDAARKELAARGKSVQKEVLMAGFSAAGSFTNRFTLLHPERVLAAAVGSPGGWPTAPVATDQGETLRYPVGIADIEELTGRPADRAALGRVHFLFFLGDADKNDAVGNIDSYSTDDSELINRLFGGTLLERWSRSEQLYHGAELQSARFEVYPGQHEVTSKMWSDMLEFFRGVLSKTGQRDQQ